jgi:signal transduction histidine kinase
MRSPLMGITASLELALTRDQAAAAPRTAVPLRNALDSARGLTELVTAMLDVSRLEAGQMPQHRQEADMRELVMDAVRPLAPLAREHTLTQTVPDSPVLVMCDRELIRRVIANLVGNALKFTPSGGTVRVELSTTAAGARVTVADTGPGVASEDHVRIFEKFGQVAARQNGHKHSTGLGLTFCKLAVEAHGGRIGVDSELGKGSVFWFELTRGWPGPAATLNP